MTSPSNTPYGVNKMSDISRARQETKMASYDTSDEVGRSMRPDRVLTGDNSLGKSDEPRIMHQIERCWDAVHHQQKVLSELMNQLSDVLRPDREDSGEKAGPSDPDRQSPMMGRIRDLEAAIRYNSSLLNDLMIRLEI